MSLVQHIEELTNILKREIRSFSAVQELLILEERSLVECDNASLAIVLEKMEDVFSSIACLEKSREDIITKIVMESNSDPDTITISRLADLVEGAVRQELMDAGHILSQLNREIQRKKVSNTMLINQSIMLVESDIRMLLNAVNIPENPDNRYTKKAGVGKTANGVCIDQRM